jgi:hypothetical protein
MEGVLVKVISQNGEISNIISRSEPDWDKLEEDTKAVLNAISSLLALLEHLEYFVIKWNVDAHTGPFNIFEEGLVTHSTPFKNIKGILLTGFNTRQVDFNVTGAKYFQEGIDEVSGTLGFRLNESLYDKS